MTFGLLPTVRLHLMNPRLIRSFSISRSSASFILHYPSISAVTSPYPGGYPHFVI